MRLLLFIFGIAATSSALALDVRDASSDLLCMYMTDDPDWQGEAFNLCEYPGVCAPELPDGLSRQVSSAGPDQGVICNLYSECDCQGEQSPPIQWPGYSNLAAIGFDDKAMSWKCVEHS